MVDPVLAYQLAQSCWTVGRFSYRLADRRVTKYAEEHDLTKKQVWTLIGQEAAKRGDTSMRAVAALGVRAANRGIPLAVAVAENLGRESVRRGLGRAAAVSAPLWLPASLLVSAAITGYRTLQRVNPHADAGHSDDELLLALPPPVPDEVDVPSPTGDSPPSDPVERERRGHSESANPDIGDEPNTTFSL